MQKTKIIVNRLLHPPVWVLVILPVAAFARLVYIFVTNNVESASAYVLYALSAYSLVIFLVALPKKLRMAKDKFWPAIVKKTSSVKFLNRYFTDVKFNSVVKLQRGAILDALYVVFRLVTGLIYSSVWFITLSVYHLFLGGLRVYLVVCKSKGKSLAESLRFEYNCYKKTAWLLFVLNVPMSGMIALMIWANSGFTYPGYVIYLSALYTFCTAAAAVKNLVQFRKVGSPILSAAKVVNLVSAMMSVLGLQTAMIAEFSGSDEAFRQTINAATGAAITIILIAIAVYMIVKSGKNLKETNVKRGVKYEQIGE